MKDDDEMDRMVQVDARMGRTMPKAERIRKAKADDMKSINKENSARVRETAEPYQPRVRYQDADHGGVAESPTTPRNVERG